MDLTTSKPVHVPGDLLLVCLLESPAIGVPVDLADPTPRRIRIEIDQELRDYAARGAAYSLPIQASFTSDGAVATIVVQSSANEAFIDQLFAGAAAAVPGSSGPADTVVPGAPYDPATGRANAVGILVPSVFDTFTPFGDVRLSETTPIERDTSVGAKDCVLLEDVSAELEVWIERGDALRVSAVNLGADGSQTLAGGQDVSFRQSPLFMVDASLPQGTRAVGCRILDPVTGETLAEDRDAFALLSTR